MSWLNANDLNEDSYDVLNGYIDPEYKIQDGFVYRYELHDVIFKDYEMKPRNKTLNYIIVRMVYEDIDWKLYKEGVVKIFKEIWNEIGFDDNKNFPIHDLRAHQFTLLSNYIDRRIFNHIFLELNKIASTNLYKNNSKLKYEEKIRFFKNFVKEFNLKLTEIINHYSLEFRSQLLIIKMMIGSNKPTIAEYEDKIKKVNRLLGRNYNQRYLNGYGEVFKRIELNPARTEREIAIEVSKEIVDPTASSNKEHIQFYKAFNKFKKKHQLKNYEDFEKFLSTFWNL